MPRGEMPRTIKAEMERLGVPAKMLEFDEGDESADYSSRHST